MGFFLLTLPNQGSQKANTDVKPASFFFEVTEINFAVWKVSYPILLQVDFKFSS